MISLEKTNSAAIAVQKELYQIGLWYENTRLYKCEIYWSWFPFISVAGADGLFTTGVSPVNKIEGFQEGHIYIPRWILAQSFWQDRASLKDVIRHEYGHAFAHYYPELIVESKRFEKAFGGNYYGYTPSCMDRSAYISEYACTMQMEDFAETFMVYVRRKGVLPLRVKDDKLVKKWKFITWVCKNMN